MAEGKPHAYGERPVDWTEDRVAELRRLWLENHTAREIADHFGTTRNGILGKAFRLALARRKSGPPPVPEPVKDRRSPQYVPPVPKPKPPRPVPVVTAMRRLKLVELENHHCRFPIGNPASPVFRFCAADRRSGATYCPTHQRAAVRHGKED
jgi:GcrA cell cycle regulator